MNAILLGLGAAGIGALLVILLSRTGTPLMGSERPRRSSRQVLTDDALKHIITCEIEGRSATKDSIRSALRLSETKTAELLAEMAQMELVKLTPPRVETTRTGYDSGMFVLRAHRLWEKYLAERTGYSADEWHVRADRAEHRLTEDTLAALDQTLSFPTHDPDGDPIPSPDGFVGEHRGQPLSDIAAADHAQIVHLEDEPAEAYAQIIAEGLHPGMVIRIVEASSHRIRFWCEGTEHVLAPVVAANVEVIPVKPGRIDEPSDGLDELPVGETGEVLEISRICRGSERRRLIDLGILRGTRIRAEFRSPAGDPTAFMIRGTTIALRRAQARNVRIKQVASRAEVTP